MKLRFVVSIVLLLIVSMFVSAQDMEIPSVTVTASDDGITFSDQVSAGLVTLHLENNRSEAEFSPGVAQLNDGVSMDDFMAAASAENPMEAVAMITLYGGTGIAPGETMDITFDLAAGDYLLLEFGEAGPSSFEPFTVAEGDMTDMAGPQSDVTLALIDFGFGVPGFISAGEHVWHIENVGMQWHEIAMIPLPEGISSVADARAAMASPDQPDIQPILFWAPMSPGTEAWITLDLEPGNYLLLCFLPDLNGDFSPHMNHGMMQVFTVE